MTTAPEHEPTPTAPPGRVGAVVLAAGASTRMGRPKQLLPVGGKTLLGHTLDTLLAAGGLSPVVVVLGAHAAEIRAALTRDAAHGEPVHFVENLHWAEGMGGSIAVGVQALRELAPAGLDAVLIAVGDQPALSVGAIGALLVAAARPGVTIGAAAYADAVGVPAVFLRKHVDELAALAGAQGARTIIARHAGAVAAVPLPELALDLDTPADYAAWLARTGVPRDGFTGAS